MALNEQEAAARYEEATAAYGPALERLARAYEPNPDLRRDLLQEIHIALWRSLAAFDGRCSLRTWIYRVAHNTATSLVFRRRRPEATFVSLDDLATAPAHDPGGAQTGTVTGTGGWAGAVDVEADRQRALGRIFELIQTLSPLDRQVILLYLEDLDAAAIGEVTGLSPGNVATKVHRIKRILSQRFHEGASHGR
jgi:RNA polymerase sigma-70 factor (ECF subfamily)